MRKIFLLAVATMLTAGSIALAAGHNTPAHKICCPHCTGECCAGQHCGECCNR